MARGTQLSRYMCFVDGTLVIACALEECQKNGTTMNNTILLLLLLLLLLMMMMMMMLAFYLQCNPGNA